MCQVVSPSPSSHPQKILRRQEAGRQVTWPLTLASFFFCFFLFIAVPHLVGSQLQFYYRPPLSPLIFTHPLTQWEGIHNKHPPLGGWVGRAQGEPFVALTNRSSTPWQSRRGREGRWWRWMWTNRGGVPFSCRMRFSSSSSSFLWFSRQSRAAETS